MGDSESSSTIQSLISLLLVMSILHSLFYCSFSVVGESKTDIAFCMRLFLFVFFVEISEFKVFGSAPAPFSLFPFWFNGISIYSNYIRHTLMWILSALYMISLLHMLSTLQFVYYADLCLTM